MRTKEVVVERYNSEWKDEFEKIKEYLKPYIGKDIISIEHIGSTSVEGLAAKPIIDIDIVIEGYDMFSKVKDGLESCGYYYEGDLGIKHREAFAYNKEKIIEFMEHHLYVCPRDSEELKRHIKFRDYLRENKEDAKEYGKVKLEGAKLYPKDIDKYIKYKSSFIKGIYRKIGS